MEPIDYSYSAVQFLDGTTFTQGAFKTKELAHTWIISGFAVRLFREGTNLSYETSKIDTGRVIVISPKRYRGSIDSAIAGLKIHHPVLKQNGQVIFCPHFRTWSTKIRAAALIDLNKELTWNIYSPTQQEYCFHSFKDITIPSKRCHPFTIDYIQSLKTAKMEEITDILLKDFRVTRILDEELLKKEAKEMKDFKDAYSLKESNAYSGATLGKSFIPAVLGESIAICSNIPLITSAYSSASAYFGGSYLAGFYGGSLALGAVGALGAAIPMSAIVGYYLLNKPKNNNEKLLEDRAKLPVLEKPIFVEIEPISVTSRIDKRIRVSKFTWAVMITAGHSGKFGNHASILIEGIASERFSFGAESGKYFMYRAHLAAPVETEFVDQAKLARWFKDGLERSEIWMRSCEKVSIMITEIVKQEQLHQKLIKNKEEVEIYLPGEDCILWEGNHNCITWAREKLKLADIFIEKSLLRKMITITKVYTESLCYYRQFPAIIQI